MNAPTNLVLAIDATNRCHVHWHAKPHNIAERFLNDVVYLRRTLNPSKLVCCFDVGRAQWRRDLVTGYKAGRVTDEDLRKQIRQTVELLQANGFTVLFEDGWEADDYLASIAVAAIRYDHKCLIASPDKDFRQCLVNGHVSILREWSISEKKPTKYLTAIDHEKKFQFAPPRWIDFQTMVGDATDGIKGWEGVGPAAAGLWLRKYTLDQILANKWLVKMDVRQERFMSDFKTRAAAIRQVVTLRTDAPLVEELF